MRSTGHPDYRYRPWSEERKQRASEAHCARLGSPPGCATIRGVHVPLKDRAPLRFWSDWLAHNYGEDDAQRWLVDQCDNHWADLPRIWELYRQRKEVSANKELIRRLEWEATYGH